MIWAQRIFCKKIEHEYNLLPSTDSLNGDGIDVPDFVWNEESIHDANFQNDGRRAPRSATVRIKVIYNKGWVKSAGKGRAENWNKVAKENMEKVVNETKRVFNDRFSKNNRLRTKIKFKMVQGERLIRYFS